MLLEMTHMNFDTEPGGGIQVLAEWHGCRAQSNALCSTSALRDICRDAMVGAGMPISGDDFRITADEGIVGAVRLAESHLLIRTWPKLLIVAIDVFICDVSHENRIKAHAVVDSLRAIFKPGKENILQLRRGGFVV